MHRMYFEERGTTVSKIPLGKDVLSIPYMKMLSISLPSTEFHGQDGVTNGLINQDLPNEV